jgi:hypothetical protein
VAGGPPATAAGDRATGDADGAGGAAARTAPADAAVDAALAGF